MHTDFSRGSHMVWYSYLFKNFPEFVVIHTIKDCETDSRNRCYSGTLLPFLMIQQMLSIWSLIPLPFLKLVWTSGSSQVMYSILLLGVTIPASLWISLNSPPTCTFFPLLPTQAISPLSSASSNPPPCLQNTAISNSHYKQKSSLDPKSPSTTVPFYPSIHSKVSWNSSLYSLSVIYLLGFFFSLNYSNKVLPHQSI